MIRKVLVRRTLFFLTLAAFFMHAPGLAAVSAEEEKKIPIYDPERGQIEWVEPVVKSEAEWRNQLLPEQYHVLREEGTERAYTGKYHKHKAKGLYRCAACGTALYRSEVKYDSRTGWPSFWEPLAEENIGTKSDARLFMQRVEVHCARCGSHLGHIFDDGPPPTGKRHCINSAALAFEEREGTPY